MRLSMKYLLSIIFFLSVGCASAQTPIKIETYKWVNDTTLWMYTTGGDSMRMEFVTGPGHHILGSVANRLFSTGGWEQDLPVFPQPRGNTKTSVRRILKKQAKCLTPKVKERRTLANVLPWIFC